MSNDKKRDYWGDVLYDVWRNGGDSDNVDRDHTDECFDSGVDAFDCASGHYLRKKQGRPDYYDDYGNPVYL